MKRIAFDIKAIKMFLKGEWTIQKCKQKQLKYFCVLKNFYQTPMENVKITASNINKFMVHCIFSTFNIFFKDFQI